jgi:hypothetical protein
MGKVVIFNGVTRLDIPAERVLKGALKEDLDKVVVIGYAKDGSEFFASSMADGGTVLWLMERLKLQLLNVQLPE